MSFKKARCPNFTAEEKYLLVSLVEKYKYLVLNKKTDSASALQKERCWAKITKLFNLNGSPRNPESLRDCWRNLKKRSRKITDDEKAGTDPLTAKVTMIIQTSADEVHHQYDCDSPLLNSFLINDSSDESSNTEARQDVQWDKCPQQELQTPTSTVIKQESDNSESEKSIPDPAISCEDGTSDQNDSASSRRNRKKHRQKKETNLEKLTKVKIDLALLAKEQAVQEFQFKKELYEIRIQQEKLILEQMRKKL